MKTLVLAAIICASSIAHADDGVIIYTVKGPNDTWDLLAAEYYRDRRDVVYLLEANGLKAKRPLKKGEKIKIPIARNIVSNKGDTFESLAAQYLGDARRGAYLAEFNERSADDTLPAGTPISIPFTVTHVAEFPESLADISLAWFSTPKQVDMLRGYNFLDRDSIDKGASIIIPIYHVKPKATRSATLDADARKRAEEHAKTNDRAISSVPAARAAWRSGDYATVRNELRGIDTQFLETALATEVGVLRGAADIAFALDGDAQGEFEAVLTRNKAATIRAYDYSPRIRVIWQMAGGTVVE